jgi:LPXTG-site transpeptidase (sortase) family protein
MEEKSRLGSDQQDPRILRLFLVGLGGLLICVVFLSPMLASSAAQEFASLTRVPGQVPGDNYLPLVFNYYPYRNSPTTTVTGTPTATLTPTPTSTGTLPTITSTSTSTATPTRTGTQATITPTPTSTVTGTLVPSPTLRVSVSPNEAVINEHFTFTIEVKNAGTGPFRNSIVSDSFPTYMDVESVTVNPASHGIVTKLAHSFTVATGDVFPGEQIFITAYVKVDSSLSRTETVSNIVTMTYDSSRSVTASVNYKVIATTLPGTGELPLNWRQLTLWHSIRVRLSWLGFGLSLVGFAAWAGKRKRIGSWFAAAGILFLVMGLLAGCSSQIEGVGTISPDLMTPTLPLGAPTQTQVPYRPASAYSTPEIIPIVILPDYPVPTPVISETPTDGETSPDTTAIVRIVIPALLLDTEVKYVPYDGFTWLIAGLRNEVAWLGNTSWPGLGSNTALAGHVTVAGMGDGPFRYLEDVPVGELIILYTEQNIYSYQVREIRITTPDDLAVTYATDNPQVTLISCVDWENSSQTYLNRLIVFGDLIRVEPVVRGIAP